MKTLALLLALLLAATLAGALCTETRSAEPTPAPKPQPPAPAGLRVFTCGHSFHAFVGPMLADMAGGAGIKGHRVAGVSFIGGSRVIQHWDVADEKNFARKALMEGKVDVLTLAPIWLPDEGIEKFARLGLKHNPDLRITIEEFWLPNDTYDRVYPVDQTRYVDHNAATIPELRKQNDLYRRDMEDFVRDLNQRLGKQAVFVVPVGEAAIALREKIVAGKVPGLKVQWRLFKDNVGHATAPLRVLAGYCHYAVIYHRSPVGLPIPADLEKNQDFAKPTLVPLNRLLQQLAWDAVIHNPLSGVTPTGK